MIRTKFYHAYYEDASKIEAAAKEAGYTGESGQSWFDFVDASMAKYRQNGYFDTVQKAEAWLKERIVLIPTGRHYYEVACLLVALFQTKIEGVDRFSNSRVDDVGNR